MRGLECTCLLLLLLTGFHLKLLAKSLRTHYDVLEVAKSASDDQIKRSFRRLALRYHPDKNSGEEATKKFAEINNAYEVLADQEKRKIYDLYGEEDLKQNQQGGTGGGNFGGGIFSTFFNGGRFGFGDEEKSSRGNDVVVEFETTLEDLYIGSSHSVWREKTVMKPAPGKRDCNCKNQVLHRQVGPGMFQQYTQAVCEECPNFRIEREGGFVTVHVEKGMKDGQAIILSQGGDLAFDGEPGDLKFVVRTSPHKTFKREGDHLYAQVTISLLEALLGFEKEIKHLDGHKVSIGTKGVTKPKEVKRFKNEGMPVYESMMKGDLFVTFEVEFPGSLSHAQREDANRIFKV